MAFTISINYCNCIYSTLGFDVCMFLFFFYKKQTQKNKQGRGHLNHEKQEFAHDHPHLKTLEEVVETIKPTAIIGLFCTVGL